MNLPLPASSPAKIDNSRQLREVGLIASLLLTLATLPAAAFGGEGTAPSRLEAVRMDGTPYSLTDSRGSVTVIEVWSPDSLASRKSIGELQRFTTLFQQRGVQIIAVSLAGDADRLRRFAAERQLDLPMAVMGGHDFGPMPEQALPLVYVFDRNGRHHATHRGLFRLRDLELLVEPLL